MKNNKFQLVGKIIGLSNFGNVITLEVNSEWFQIEFEYLTKADMESLVSSDFVYVEGYMTNVSNVIKLMGTKIVGEQ